MIPSPWVGVVLALAVFRCCRLIGWDDFPPVKSAREWITGARSFSRSKSSNAAMGLTGEEPTEIIVYKRPLFAHFISCAYCIGFWIGLIFYLGWIWFPTETLYVAAPFALSGAVGIIARTLDP